MACAKADALAREAKTTAFIAKVEHDAISRERATADLNRDQESRTLAALLHTQTAHLKKLESDIHGQQKVHDRQADLMHGRREKDLSDTVKSDSVDRFTNAHSKIDAKLSKLDDKLAAFNHSIDE